MELEYQQSDNSRSGAFHAFLLLYRDVILKRWSYEKNIRSLIARLKLSPQEHQTKIATPVLDNLIHLLLEPDMDADCPVMRNLVETFYNRGLAVEDVFLNCTGLKNVILELLFEQQNKTYDINAVMTILDNNLYRVLSVYTEKLADHEKSLKLHNSIIEEHVVLTITDVEGKITHVTDAFSELSGYSKEDLMGQSHALIRHPEVSDAFFKGMWKRILQGRSWKGKIKNLKKDGGEFIARTEIVPVKDDRGRILEFIAIRNDITDKELSGLDPLTGLCNRRKFDSLMENYFAKEIVLSLIIVDLDHFKKINDTYGHAGGDRVLKEFAQIINASTRSRDISSRWGGEEFVILLPDTPCDVAYTIAERIRTTTEASRILDDLPIRCSIGLTEQVQGDTVQSFFERADRFLYLAKSSGRNRTITDSDCIEE